VGRREAYQRSGERVAFEDARAIAEGRYIAIGRAEFRPNVPRYVLLSSDSLALLSAFIFVCFLRPDSILS
jgi:hypothetical protein